MEERELGNPKKEHSKELIENQQKPIQLHIWFLEQDSTLAKLVGVLFLLCFNFVPKRDDQME